MANTTGTPETQVWGTNINPAAQNVSIPANATAVVWFWAWYNGGNGVGLASVTLGGNAPSQTFEVPSVSTGNGQPAGGVAIWYNPTTGTQALDPAWDQAPGDGPNSIVVYVEDLDTSGWRDADGGNDQDGNAVSVTLTTVAGDMVLAFDSHFATTIPSEMGGSWTSVATQAETNSYSARCSSIVAAGTTQVVDAQDESYTALIAISIIDAAAGGATIYTRRPLDSPVFNSRVIS